MKLKYLSAEFLLIFLILALPPLLTGSSGEAPAAPRFSLANLETLAIAVLLCLQLRRELPRPPCPAFRRLSIATMTFGGLMLSYAAVELGGTVLFMLFGQGKFLAASRQITGAGQWLLATAALATGAFYEECLYRAFLPEIPLLLLDRAGETWVQGHKKTLSAGIEAACVIVFALSHRYLGMLAVTNALLCGSVLRVCYKKSGGILCGMAAHFCYNMTLLLFSSLTPA